MVKKTVFESFTDIIFEPSAGCDNITLKLLHSLVDFSSYISLAKSVYEYMKFDIFLLTGTIKLW